MESPCLIYGTVLLLGYLLGAIPFGFLVAKAKGVNILKVGSGNVGATNVRRTVGRRAGLCVFFLDAAKGILAASLPDWHWIFGRVSGNTLPLAMVGLLGAVIGHSFSIFLKFRGGKGVSVVVGGIFAAMPNLLILGAITWVAVFSTTRFVSLASLCFCLTLPLCSYVFAYPPAANGLVLAMVIIVFIRHLPNIRRLLNGTEYRFDLERYPTPTDGKE
ncbi:MAG: glycerol-3-phosphate 1-O-acyltransferase PlsY [Puniceicoccales bacterium]|nr:glycerol-3-phosphate 1-O-acyltransferase PlsY [Puniceicoccales bacterium]